VLIISVRQPRHTFEQAVAAGKEADQQFSITSAWPTMTCDSWLAIFAGVVQPADGSRFRDRGLHYVAAWPRSWGVLVGTGQLSECGPANSTAVGVQWICLALTAK
jgi:hypothetical protein